ncbi:hypothetical protein [Amycolatopsis sp.]|uniref:hypothetical protein n=1 Tax=Amycolatopsis sp. TaxID=37632 RepID=UPI002D7FEAFC|nr:hypothetical protein [Amycolatopsis sp.]HET6703964.1 hypothetical protein [Amycolatopsis sp.]
MGTRMRTAAGIAGVLGALALGFPGTANAAAPGGKIWVSSYSANGAEGYAEDTASDGYCVQARLTWFGSGGKQDTDWSEHACPKGEKAYFDKAPGDGTHWRANRLVVDKCFIKDGKSSCSEVFDESLG